MNHVNNFEPNTMNEQAPATSNTTPNTTPNTPTVEPVPLQLGQTYTATGLIITRKGPDSSTWFIDSARNTGPLDQVHVHHQVHLGEVQKNLMGLGQARWTQASIAAFLAGQSVNALDLWREVAAFIRRYFSAPDAVVNLIAAWVMLTYVFTAAETVPYLHVLGEPATGKTLLGDLLEGLCFSARQAVSITTAAIHRLLHSTTGTLILDEQGAGDKTWINIMRAGYRRSGTVTVCDGDVPVERRCFGPKVLLTNDPLPDAALASRAIIIELGPSTGQVERYTAMSAASEMSRLRDALHVFGLTHARQVEQAYLAVDRVDGLSHRELDLAAPLLAVAEVVDQSPGTQAGLRAALTDILKALAGKRRTDQRVQGERGALARAVVRFAVPLEDESPPAYSWGGNGDWHLASDLLASVNQSGELDRPLSPRDLGERLKRYRLATDRQVIDVGRRFVPFDKHGPRVQRVAYRLDLDAARQSAKGEV